MSKLTARKLNSQETETIIQQKLAWILGACAPERVILFGSATRGEMTESSDIDLIVIFSDQETQKSACERLWKTRPPNDWPHDLIFHTTQSFAESCSKGGGASWLAEREGRVLYQKGAT